MTALVALRNFARPRPEVERCELCGAEVPAAHAHLFERRTERLACACAVCERLLGSSDATWTIVRTRRERLTRFELTDAHWQALGVPIELAFFVQSSRAGRVVARYPSAAGPVECGLALSAWETLVAANPVLAELAPDVEALLVRGAGGRREHYRASIDECYRLVGIIRRQWRGVGGGPEVWQAIDTFFDDGFGVREGAP